MWKNLETDPSIIQSNNFVLTRENYRKSHDLHHLKQ